MQSNLNENEYLTSDFLEAVVLKYLGYKLIFVNKTDRRAVFHFEFQGDIYEVLNALRGRELKVEPFTFYQCEREIKSRLYND